jgi:hypothetical protein
VSTIDADSSKDVNQNLFHVFLIGKIRSCGQTVLMVAIAKQGHIKKASFTRGSLDSLYSLRSNYASQVQWVFLSFNVVKHPLKNPII